jgi:hypothetical protein
VRRLLLLTDTDIDWNILMFKRLVCVMALTGIWLTVPTPASAQMT